MIFAFGQDPAGFYDLGKTGNGHFGPNPGLERFGAGFWHLGSLHLAIQLLTKERLETAILGQILARNFLELVFGIWASSTWLSEPFWAEYWPGAFWSWILEFGQAPGGY